MICDKYTFSVQLEILDLLMLFVSPTFAPILTAICKIIEIFGFLFNKTGEMQIANEKSHMNIKIEIIIPPRVQNQSASHINRHHNIKPIRCVMDSNENLGGFRTL